MKRTLANRDWRLDNLYTIADEQGRVIPFVRNDPQRELWRNRWYANVILKARQLGFSTFIEILMLDEALFQAGTACGLIDATLDDAKKKLAKIRFAWENLRVPAVYDLVALTKENAQELAWSNGSSIQVGTSHRGGTLQVLHVSEFGKISSATPEKAREIRTGAFGTVHRGQYIFVESTAEGSGGAFYDIVQRAEAIQKQGRRLSELDFRLHFFPWWRHKGYVLDPLYAVIDRDLAAYFDEVEQKIGQTLTAEQRAWYAAKREQIGPDDMFREYPATPEEAFMASVQGAYFKTQMLKAREQGRIGVVPVDTSRPVNTFWDIGKDDSTAIWFHQHLGARHHLVDYFEDSGEGVDYYARILREKAAERGWTYGKHYGPHDLDNSHWILPGEEATVDVARRLGIKFEVVPRIPNKQQAIDAARNFLGLCWIDETHCAAGIRCLDNYRKAWDEKRGTYKSEPLHDWASHGADALQCGACGFTPDYIPPPVDRYERRRRQGSAWAA